MKNLITILMGEPESINTEIIAKSYKKLNPTLKKRILIVGSFKLFQKQLNVLKIKLAINEIKSINTKLDQKKLNIYNVNLKFSNPFKINKLNNKKYQKKCIEIVNSLSVNDTIKGFINCAIDKKKLFNKDSIGLTEFLSKKNNVYGNEIMMIYNKKISVVPLTTHIRLKNIFKKISKEKIVKKVTNLNNNYKKLFGFKPKILILGINPHNDEYRKNSEEIKYIIPAIKYLSSKNLSIFGPYSTDTAFSNYNLKKFDVIFGIYHDQVLTPFKALFNLDAVNITLGLPFIRISPDHGTGKDIIKKNKADPASLLKCINFFSNITLK